MSSRDWYQATSANYMLTCAILMTYSVHLGTAERFNESQPASYYSKLDLETLKGQPARRCAEGAGDECVNDDVSPLVDGDAVQPAAKKGTVKENAAHAKKTGGEAAQNKREAEHAAQAAKAAKAKAEAEAVHVVELTAANYAATVKKGTWMVFWSAAWCKHCQTMMPDYNTYERTMKSYPTCIYLSRET